MAAIPLLHLTDLYLPPQDPDDFVDLATVHALPELDIRGIVLDCTRRFLDEVADGDLHREPGLLPVIQLQQLTGRSYPVAIGPLDPLADPHDAARGRSRAQQAGVELILRVLREAPEPVVVSVVSSLRPLAAALNRDPELCAAKIRRVLVNAGTASRTSAPDEWNVLLDVHAYVRVLTSGLPIDWYPCAGKAGSFALEERTSYWAASQRALLGGLPRPLRAWFHYGFSGNRRGDVLRALRELGAGLSWEMCLDATRSMWSTASLVMAAGRVLARTHHGWRFEPGARSDVKQRATLRLDPIALEVDAEGNTTWSPAVQSHVRLFRRDPASEHHGAMTEALAALLAAMPLDEELA
jgi:inosine-uridine preferring nucleoside hydrolase